MDKPIQVRIKTDVEGLSSMGTQVWLGDREIIGVRALHVHAAVGDIRRVELELVEPDLDITFPAQVNVVVMPVPGHDLLVRTEPDGSTRYQVIEKATMLRHNMFVRHTIAKNAHTEVGPLDA